MNPYHHHLPQVGYTRCYWALLSADLQFIYLDPVLAYHLDTEANTLIGKSLLSFLHPDEQASAKNDLRGVLQSRTLHGSVTRVRLLRLSKVRRTLGHTGPPPQWSDAEKIAIDDNYMAVDIVINWAADGLVLCFIHASVDLDPLSDNDELHKSHWSNWCGTPNMPPDQIQLLFHQLVNHFPQSPSPSGTPSRIFQILSNQPHRQLLLSWPPDQGNGPTGRDFAKLVENAEMGSGPQKGNDAKTSCTRRYRATQLMSPSLGEVESIFIPHGAVIFACHKVESSIRSTSTNSPTTMQNQMSYNSNNGPNYPPPGPSYYDPPSSYPPLGPAYSQDYLPHQPLPVQPQPSTYSQPRWSQHQQQNYHQSQPPPSAHPQWATPSPTHPLSPLPPPSASVPPSSSMPSSHFRSAPYSVPAAVPPSSWQTASGGYDVYRAPSPGYNPYPSTSSRGPLSSTAGTSILPTPSSLLSPTAAPPPPSSASTTTSIPDTVPPPKRRVSPGSIRGSGDHQYPPGTTASGSGRSSGNRPSGVLECSSCGATSSPEWRKGPSGKKELCNACGLRYARSRAKKDGSSGTTSGSGQGRKKKSDSGDGSVSVKTEPRDKTNYHHVVGGSGSSNGIEIKREIRHRKRDSASGGPTPPLATIAAAGGSSGYASTILRRSFGSGSEYPAPGTSPSRSGSEGHGHGYGGHAHYATLAASANSNASAGQCEGTGHGTGATPSPPPPVGAPATPTSVPSASNSGSMGLHLSGASPSPPSPVPLHQTVSTPSTSTTTAPADSSSGEIGFIHYYPPPPVHERTTVPSLSVHPHSHSHSRSPHSPHPHSHPHSPAGSASNNGGHPHSPLPVFSTTAAHYVHGYKATRPSPLSQAGNIFTGSAPGPLTPLSVPHSATDPPEEHSESSSASNHHHHSPSTTGASGNGNGMQLPPLAYMDRLVGSTSGSAGHNGHGGYGGGNGGDVLQSVSGSGSNASASGFGREPLTPLSAESPIGPGPGVARNARRTILGGQ